MLDDDIAPHLDFHAKNQVSHRLKIKLQQEALPMKNQTKEVVPEHTNRDEGIAQRLIYLKKDQVRHLRILIV